MEIDRINGRSYRQTRPSAKEIAKAPGITISNKKLPPGVTTAPPIQPVTPKSSVTPPSLNTGKGVDLSQGFIFKIASLDTNEVITFLNPFISDYSHQIQSGEDAFSRPFHEGRNAQSAEGTSQSFSFPDLVLDIRYKKVAEDISSIEGVIEKLRMFMEPNTIRLRKHRLSIQWGSKIIGQPPKTYLFMNSLDIRPEQFNDLGNYVTARLSMNFSLYHFY